MKRTVLAVLAGLSLGLLAAAVRGHGGQYQSPGAGQPTPPSVPGARVPRGAMGGTTGRGLPSSSLQGTTGTAPSWETWWEHNRDEFFDVRGRALARTHPELREDGYAGEGPLSPPGPSEIRDGIVPILLEALVDRDREVRDSAAIALGRAGSIPECEALLRALADPDQAVAEAATIGLGLLRFSRAESALVRILTEPGTPHRQRALSALALGLSGGPDARESLAAHLGERGGDDLVTRLRRQDMAGCRALALGLTGDTTTTALLVRLLRESDIRDASFRPLLLVGLAKLGDPAALPAVRSALGDRRTDVRRAAAIAFGRLLPRGAADDIAPLLAAIAADSDTHVRCFAAISAGRVGGEAATNTLRTLFGTARDREVRAFAAIALGIAGDVSSLPDLLAQVREGADPDFAGAAAIAIGILGRHEPAADLLEALGKTRNPGLRSHLVTSLAMLGDAAVLPAARDILVRSRNAAELGAAALALGLLGDRESVDTLVRVLRSAAQTAVRGAVALSLGLLGDRRAIGPLTTLVRSPSEQPAARAFAVVALGVLGETASPRPLARISVDTLYALRVEAIAEINDIF